MYLACKYLVSEGGQIFLKYISALCFFLSSPSSTYVNTPDLRAYPLVEIIYDSVNLPRLNWKIFRGVGWLCCGGCGRSWRRDDDARSHTFVVADRRVIIPDRARRATLHDRVPIRAHDELSTIIREWKICRRALLPRGAVNQLRAYGRIQFSPRQY